MIDRSHALPLARQARELGISRGSIYYLPRPVPPADLAIMRRIDELHLEFPFAGSRMLRDLLRQEGFKIGRQHVGTLMKTIAIEAIYRRPSTSKALLSLSKGPRWGTRSIPICCASWRSCVPTKSGRPTSVTFRWRGALSISLPSWTGSAARFWPGGCRSRWKPIFVSRLWKKHWRASANRRFSIPIRAANSRAWPSQACCSEKKSP